MLLACYLIDLTHAIALNDKTPFEMWNKIFYYKKTRANGLEMRVSGLP